LVDADGDVADYCDIGGDGSYAITAEVTGDYTLTVVGYDGKTILASPVPVTFGSATPCPIVVDLTVSPPCLDIGGRIRRRAVSCC